MSYSVNDRPLRILIGEHTLRNMERWEWKLPINEKCHDSYRAQFDHYSSASLRMYYAILKSDYEVWDAWDTNKNQVNIALISAFVSAALTLILQAFHMAHSSLFLNTLAGLVLGLTLGLFGIPVFLHLVLPIRRAVIKKSKAVLFMAIIEQLLAERTNRDVFGNLVQERLPDNLSQVDNRIVRRRAMSGIHRKRKGSQIH